MVTPPLPTPHTVPLFLPPVFNECRTKRENHEANSIEVINHDFTLEMIQNPKHDSEMLKI